MIDPESPEVRTAIANATLAQLISSAGFRIRMAEKQVGGRIPNAQLYEDLHMALEYIEEILRRMGGP